MSEPGTWDVVWARGRLSVGTRLRRLRSKAFFVAQASVAGALAWWIASSWFDHPVPFLAPVAAVVCLGTSYSQRHRRVAEVMVGVAIGVLVADVLVLAIGNGPWQLGLVVALSMSTALLLDAGAILVTQAAVQSIVVSVLVPAPGQALLRWTDAVIGGAVALLAATVVPAAPLRRPRDSAAGVADKIAFLLRGAAQGLRHGDAETTLALLRDARSTEVLIDDLRQAAAEGASIVRSSPFRRAQRGSVRQVAELVEPLDLALRNTRVLVRRAAVAAYRGDRLPVAYADLCDQLAETVDLTARELRADRQAVSVQPELVRVAAATSEVERTALLSAEVVLAQLRSIIADLLRVTGMTPIEATDAIPPLRGG